MVFTKQAIYTIYNNKINPNNGGGYSMGGGITIDY